MNFLNELNWVNLVNWINWVNLVTWSFGLNWMYQVDGAKCDLQLLLRFVYFRFSKDPSLSFFNVSFEKDPKKDPGGKVQ